MAQDCGGDGAVPPTIQASGRERVLGAEVACQPYQFVNECGSHGNYMLPVRGVATHMRVMIPLSILDLSPVPEGSDAGEAIRNSADLARHAEKLGYNRFWMAEHHNMPGIASAATAVALAHVANGTSRIRIGAGGIMLPNHAPLMVAEQFGTLAALYPGRIDLGLGRAPGTDQNAMRAMRRNMAGGADEFPRDVVELMNYFRPTVPGQALQAVPGAGLDVDVWVLGSSTFGAQLAAHLGLPYAFASHFAPAQMMEAIAVYRETFRPSERLAKPYVMLGCGVFAADTDEEARLLFSSQQQAFVNLRTGQPGKLPRPVEGYEEGLDPYAKRVLASSLSCSFVGARETVRRGLEEFIERTGADELMVTAMIHDPEARKRSFEILAQVHAEATARPESLKQASTSVI
ncbi:MAG: alkane 1-monooxygenase [Rubritepida sp.]|nr:alkane 1-monooxygenase [Rubritepida sp.]